MIELLALLAAMASEAAGEDRIFTGGAFEILDDGYPDEGVFTIRCGLSSMVVDVSADRVWIFELETEPGGRGRGHARKIMEYVCAACDNLGMTATLKARAGRETQQDRLVSFYESFDFRTEGADGNVPIMRRKPR